MRKLILLLQPYYILTEDGSSLKTDHFAADRAMWMESMWLHLHQGISVVLMSEDMFKDNKVGVNLRTVVR